MRYELSTLFDEWTEEGRAARGNLSDFERTALEMAGMSREQIARQLLDIGYSRATAAAIADVWTQAVTTIALGERALPLPMIGDF